MAFDPQALWDLTSPITMPAMSDNDFLMLLEKQMQAAHPTSGNGVASDGQQSFSNNLMVTPSSVMAPPPVPADTMSPPFTEDSSPSPPSANNNDNNVGDGPKRKASKDDSGNPESQPRSKVQHKDNEDSVNSQPADESTKKPTRRKSGGGAGISEEGRLAKRKEQNRAAQRAFRDRKEKHVKDLEDKIQELEQKYNTSESENTNLKDLLRRLQNENMMLKQSAFTFEFTPTDKSTNQTATSPTANTSSSLSSAGTNPFTSPSHSHSSASPESTTANYISKSPQNSLFTANNTPSPNLNASDSRENVTVNSAGMLAFSNPSTAQPTPATPALSVSSPGAGPSSISHGAFSQTSLFTSYRDSSASYSLGVPFGDFNTFGPSASGMAAEFGMDFGMDMPSFGTNDLGAFGLGNDFDDLFGGQLGALDGTNAYGGVGSPSSTGLMTSAPTPQSTSVSSAPTPASTQTPLIIDGLPSVGESARVECSIKAPSASDWRRCPKSREEFVDLVRNDSTKPSTFGPPLSNDDKAQIEQDWKDFTQLPQVKELDVDNLCHELFDKAQCTELKTRMKQSMMRIAKDMAQGPNAA